MSEFYPPPGSLGHQNMLEEMAWLKIYENHKKKKIDEKVALYTNFFRKKHKSELNSGKLSDDDIKKMAIKYALKNFKTNGGKTKRRSSKRRHRTLKRK
jgi:hypothetical protein